LEAIKYARAGFTIILIGHADHDEVIGTMGEAPSAILVVGSAADVDKIKIPDPTKVAYLTQTTLSLDDTRGIIARLRQKYPLIQGPASEDICYATQNRQGAVLDLARHAEMILVVGSANSSNSRRLVEVSGSAGIPAYLIDDIEDIQPEWLDGIGVVGLTAGASAPEELVERVVGYLSSLGFPEVETLGSIIEHVEFALPPELAKEVHKTGG
jgi:4-hydroxy-3-methylbut-2-enyl diphosphate reductase